MCNCVLAGDLLSYSYKIPYEVRKEVRQFFFFEPVTRKQGLLYPECSQEIYLAKTQKLQF